MKRAKERAKSRASCHQQMFRHLQDLHCINVTRKLNPCAKNFKQDYIYGESSNANFQKCYLSDSQQHALTFITKRFV